MENKVPSACRKASLACFDRLGYGLGWTTTTAVLRTTVVLEDYRCYYKLRQLSIKDTAVLVIIKDCASCLLKTLRTVARCSDETAPVVYEKTLPCPGHETAVVY